MIERDFQITCPVFLLKKTYGGYMYIDWSKNGQNADAGIFCFVFKTEYVSM